MSPHNLPRADLNDFVKDLVHPAVVGGLYGLVCGRLARVLGGDDGGGGDGSDDGGDGSGDGDGSDGDDGVVVYGGGHCGGQGGGDGDVGGGMVVAVVSLVW